MKPLLFALALTGCAATAFSATAFAAPATVTNPAIPPVPRAATPTAPASASGFAADVNGEKITVAELNRRVEALKASEPALQTNTPQATDALKQVRAQMLDDLVTIKLLSQEARRRKIVTATKDVDDSIGQLKAQFKSEADFNKWLSESGVTQADVRKRIADELALDEVTKQVTSDVTVSDADIAAFYRAHPEDFTINAAVKARHILLAVNSQAPAADKEAVRKRAQNIINQLKKGGDFVALAKTYSDDQSNKNRGGDLPIFERGMMVKPFEDAAFGAKKGDIVGPVETEYGMHIIKIEEVLPQKIVEYKDIKDEPRLRAVILRDKKQDKFDAFVAGLKASAKIQKFA